MGTLTTLAALPTDKINSLAGPIAAITETAEKLHLQWLIPVAAASIAVGQLGAAGSYLAACARIPFAIGVDHALPPAFARLHPKWGTPYLALITQSILAALLILLSQAGASVRGAYAILISMTIIANFIPYLFLFAAMIKLQGVATHHNFARVPGGPKVAVGLAAVGFLTTLLAIALAFVPLPEEPHKALAIAKTVGATGLVLAVGYAIFAARRKSAQ